MPDAAGSSADTLNPSEVPGPEAQPRGVCLPPPETPPPPPPSTYTSWGPPEPANASDGR